MTQQEERRRPDVASSSPPPPTPAPSRHGPIAQLLIAWSPLSLVLAGYFVAQWIAAPLEAGSGHNRLGLPLHVTGPADADRAVFGEVPTVWLQQQLSSASAQWYDALAALVYVTHFLALPVMTGLVWFRWRERFRSWLAAVLTLTGAGYVGYVVYPAAPPWAASERGVIGTVDRISDLGWEYLHLDQIAVLTTLGQGQSNTFAAMPSLHAGMALLIAVFLWPIAGRTARVLLIGYALSMSLTLIYTGEHYVVDAVAGWVLAVAAAGVGHLVLRADRST